MAIDELYTHLLNEGLGDLLQQYPDHVSIADFDIEREGRAIRVASKPYSGRSRYRAAASQTGERGHLCALYHMLRLARAANDRQEITGQIQRLLGTPVAWMIGWVPKGNSGGANVSPLLPMPLPADMAADLADFSVGRDVWTRVVIEGACLTALYVAVGYPLNLSKLFRGGGAAEVAMLASNLLYAPD